MPQFPSVPVFELSLVFKSRHCNGVQPSRVLNLPLSSLFSLSLPSLRQLLLLFALSLSSPITSHRSYVGSYIQAQAAVFEAEGETLPLLYTNILCLKGAQAPTGRSLP